MRAYIQMLALLVVTSACDNSNERSESYEQRLEAPPEAVTQTQEPEAEPQQNHPSYREAKRCSALVNIIEILVDSGVITDRNITNNVDRVSGAWHERARLLGGQIGRTDSEVQLDIDKVQLELLAPLKSLPESQAAARIQGLVREAGSCEG